MELAVGPVITQLSRARLPPRCLISESRISAPRGEIGHGTSALHNLFDEISAAFPKRSLICLLADVNARRHNRAEQTRDKGEAVDINRHPRESLCRGDIHSWAASKKRARHWGAKVQGLHVPRCPCYDSALMGHFRASPRPPFGDLSCRHVFAEHVLHFCHYIIGLISAINGVLLGFGWKWRNSSFLGEVGH